MITADDIKSQVALLDVAQRYTTLAERREGDWWGNCPIHSESEPSFHVLPDDGFCKCFGCGFGGDVFALVMAVERCDFAEALGIIAKRAGLPFGGMDDVAIEAMQKAREARLAASDLLGQIASECAKALPGSPAETYLHQRAINAETLQRIGIGYLAERSAVAALLDSAPPGAVEAAGLANVPAYFWSNRVIVPIEDRGRVVGVYSRAATNDCPKKQRHLFTSGSLQGIFNADHTSRHEPVILTEAILDAVSLIEVGIENVVSLGSPNASAELLGRLRRFSGIVIIFDWDEDTRTGQTRSLEVARDLMDLDVTVRIASPRPDDGASRDLNDMLRGDATREDFERIIGGAVAPVEFKRMHDLPLDRCLLVRDGETFVYGSSGLQLVAEGVEREASGDLKATVVVKSSGQTAHRDRLALSSARRRREFASAVAGDDDERREVIERSLLALDDELRLHLVEQESVAASSGHEPEYEMSDGELGEAEELLGDPEFLHRVARDLDTIGCVGEVGPKVLTYLAMTSRIQQTPVAVCLKGQSSSGKSNVAKQVGEFCPPESLRDLSRITTQALFYVGADYLKHRFVVVREKPGGEDADYSVRTMLSERGLSLLGTEKDDAGGLVARERFVEGPMAYLETTTETTINFENATRLLEIYVDESSEQTRRVVARQQKEATLDGILCARERDAIICRHRNAQRLLRPLTVVVPFAEQISFPTQKTRARRDFLKLLEVVKLVALCHQKRREIGTAGDAYGSFDYIEADLLDYALAYELVAPVLASGMSEVDERCRDLLRQIQAMVAHAVGADAVPHDGDALRARFLAQQFTRRDVHAHTHIARRTLPDRLSALADAGYVTVVEGGPGKPFVYTLADAQDSGGAQLDIPTPDALEAALEGETS